MISPNPTSSQSPSIYCENVEINILTDRYPEETSWTLSQIISNNNELITEIVLEGNPSEKENRYSNEICLDYGEYNFTIYDTYGDGLLRITGGGGYNIDGYYNILLYGNVIAHGGDFGYNETTSFSVTRNRPSTSPSLSLIPTISPSISQYPSMSSPPTGKSILW